MLCKMQITEDQINIVSKRDGIMPYVHLLSIFR